MRSDSNVADILDPFCGTGGLDFGLLRQSRCLVNTFELITIYEFSSAIAMSAVYAGSGNISLFAMFIREKFRKNGALDLGYDRWMVTGLKNTRLIIGVLPSSLSVSMLGTSGVLGFTQLVKLFSANDKPDNQNQCSVLARAS